MNPVQHAEKFVLMLRESIDNVKSVVCRSRVQGIDPSVFALADTTLSLFPYETVIEEFIRRSYHMWSDIHSKKQEAILQNLQVIMKGISEEKIQLTYNIIIGKDENGNPYVTDAEREIFWDFFQQFVKRSLLYIHSKSQPIQHGASKTYSSPVIPEDYIRSQANLWSLKKIQTDMGW